MVALNCGKMCLGSFNCAPVQHQLCILAFRCEEINVRARTLLVMMIVNVIVFFFLFVYRLISFFITFSYETTCVS